MMENLEEFACPINQSKILIKGKRTKRQRVPSPYGGGVPTMASSSSTYSSSPTSSITTHDVYDSTDQEDEDMANCLILLAQGGGDARKVGKDGHGFKKMDRIDGCSKKIMETVTSTAGKAGYYVYECKTCNRSFPSFQALGGHRASHKKPKIINLVEHKKNQEILVPPPRDEIVMDKIINPSSSLPELYKKANKSHECSICGAKFTSGQALGGHMRRHRSGPPPTGIAASAAQISLSSTVDHSSSTTSSGLPEGAYDVQKPSNILALDLNLPAPEDDQREIKFKFVTPQKSLVMSCPTLVDCHY